jgi:hypothetical protein
MKLRSIELTNVRRFAGRRAILGGIGDGITVLSEPNEFGKSTFFDALHALFFEKHRSTRAPIKALQPHAGGGPEVTVEVELPEGRFRITKRWLQRAQAQVMDGSGRLIAQADEAEAWLDRLLGGNLAGPSGILWVRQGLSGLEPEGSGTDEKRERERSLEARRDLLSSVAGEIDLVTGGRRMDKVLGRVAEDLAQLATPSLRPKAGGDWFRALDEAAKLADEEGQLRPRAERLTGDIRSRGEEQRTLARLTDPQLVAARTEGLRNAEALHQAALAHKSKLEQSEGAVRLATLNAETVAREAARLEALANRVEQARAALGTAEGQAARTRARAEDLGNRDRAATEAVDDMTKEARDLRTRVARATQASAARAAEGQATELRRRLDRASGLLSSLNADRARRAQIVVTAKTLEVVEKALAALELARARAEAQAVTIEALPEGAATATIGGRPLPTGPHPVLGQTTVSLPGFGSLRIDPGEAAGAAAAAEVDKAALAVDRTMSSCKAETIIQARQSWAEAQELDRIIAQNNAIVDELVPDGIAALGAELAKAEAEAAIASSENEDANDLSDALTNAEQRETEARAAAKVTHDLFVAASEARAVSEADRRTAERQLTEAEAEAGDSGALSERIASLRERAPDLDSARDQATQALAVLQAAAPDLVTTEAGLLRAKGVVDQARKAEADAREKLASLNATISALADEGIEERLAELADARVEVQARATRYEAEVRSLTRLRRALEDARMQARDSYFGPILRELHPLLSILHPGAVLSIDDTSLLPASLTRNGQVEALDILSGGTREQVAILTRLAFARLFASAGRPVPVIILDDALVHSDDDRIEAMFTALHRTARDQQILVLTCRQRAFAALGGTHATVRVDVL